MSELNIRQRLSNIQNELVVTKNQRNTFGNYNFRSAEDILEAVKPICKNHDTVLVVSDKIILVGDRNYVEATATLYDFTGNLIIATASAREALIQKGMQDAQITGSSSSYARKYALGGLFNLDDNKDPDATNKHGKGTKQTEDVSITYKKVLALNMKPENIKQWEEYYKVTSLFNLDQEQMQYMLDTYANQLSDKK